jgi:hypothetical protein
MSSYRFLKSLLILPCLLFLLPATVWAGGDDEWRPLDPADLALKAPVVEKDADAEAIFWEVRIDDSLAEELSLKNYIRIKVFTERGKESQSKIDLPYSGSNRIKDIAARVIKSDNTIVELKKDDVFERTIVKANGVKVKAKSFALPSVEPGSIIEYRWREVVPNGSANKLRLKFQRDIPIQNISYFLKPYMGMRYVSFHMADEAKFVKDKNGFSRLTMTNMPAYHEEPRMPPEDEVRSWVFLYYSEELKIEEDKYWKEFGKKLYEVTKDDMKVNDDVKNAVAGIVGNATAAEEKLHLIYDFCRTKIKNISDDASGISADERKKIKESKSPGETLKRGMGTGGNIDMLFAALAKALAGNRDDLFFNKGLANATFLESSFIAVKVGEQWEYYSPAEMYTPFGMLGWREEGVETLIADAKEPIWAKTPISPPEKSMEKRTGKLRLLEDGTLEGDIQIEYTGHIGFDKKEYDDDDSPAQREETLRNSVKARMSTAELSDIKIENVTDPIKPYTYSFHVRVPGYAQRTGKRIFLQPAFFEHGLSPIFSSSDRKHAIYFQYPWLEEDNVTIDLPTGYALDSADSPGPIEVGKISEYKPTIGITKDGKTLSYKRHFFFGGGASILYPVATYPNMKALFETINKADNHTITLKQTATTASN